MNYDLQEYLDWGSANSNDYYTGADYTDNDGQGALKVEHLSLLKADKNGFMRIITAINVRGTPDGFDDIGKGITIHNHVNEGRKYWILKVRKYT